MTFKKKICADYGDVKVGYAPEDDNFYFTDDDFKTCKVFSLEKHEPILTALHDAKMLEKSLA